MKLLIHLNEYIRLYRIVRIAHPVIMIVLIMIFFINNSKAQCPSGCDVTITASSNMTTAITINNSASTNQYCFNAAAGDIVYTGSINLQSGGTMVICGGTSNVVYLNGSFTEGTNGVRNIIVNGNLVINDADGSVGFSKSTITVNGTLTLIGQGSPSAAAITGGAIIVNSGGKVIIDAVNSNLAGANFDIPGVLELTGNLLTSASSVFQNTGLLKIAGDASFSGTYHNHGVWQISGKLSLNASALSNLTGGLFYCKNLELNSARITADAGSCAAFVVSDFSDINSAGLSATGDIGLFDQSSPGEIDDVNTTCQAGDAAPWNTGPYCGIRPLMALSGSGTCFNTLPVVWHSFTGKKSSNSQVQLNWTTLEENNAATFTVQRSSDGLEYEDLYIMNAFGNSTSLKNYTYNDYAAFDESYYYRLKQTDKTNYSAYSDIIFVNSSSLNSELRIYPNPASFENSVAIAVSNFMEEENAKVILMDIRGTILYTFENLSGYKELVLNAGGELQLSKGIYIVVAKGNSFVSTQQLIIE